MTNKELLRKILADQPIALSKKDYEEDQGLLEFIMDVFNVRQNSNSAITECQAWEFTRTYVNYNYIYYKSKGKNSRTIKKGKFKSEDEYNNSIQLNIVMKLMSLLYDRTNLEDIIKDLKNE